MKNPNPVDTQAIMLTLALEAGEIHNADVLSLVKYFKTNM